MITIETDWYKVILRIKLKFNAAQLWKHIVDFYIRVHSHTQIVYEGYPATLTSWIRLLFDKKTHIKQKNSQDMGVLF